MAIAALYLWLFATLDITKLFVLYLHTFAKTSNFARNLITLYLSICVVIVLNMPYHHLTLVHLMFRLSANQGSKILIEFFVDVMKYLNLGATKTFYRRQVGCRPTECYYMPQLHLGRNHFWNACKLSNPVGLDEFL